MKTNKDQTDEFQFDPYFSIYGLLSDESEIIFCFYKNKINTHTIN